MSVMAIPIVIDALGAIFKGMIRGMEAFKIGGQVETIQTELLRSGKILRTVLAT